MKVDMLADIERFHVNFGLETIFSENHALPEDMQEFRLKFMEEELDEYAQAVLAGDAEKALDALVDLTYVALGTAWLHGFPFAEAWRRVQDANMKKVRAARAEESLRGTAYDVVKPAGWEAPRLADLLGDSGHTFTGEAP